MYAVASNVSPGVFTTVDWWVENIVMRGETEWGA